MKLFRRILTIAAILLVWGGIVFYIVWASGKSRERRAESRIERIDIRIADSPKVNIVTAAAVMEWLAPDTLNPIIGTFAARLDTRDIVNAVMADPIVEQAKSYVDMDNVLHVWLRQRKPAMRIMTGSGYDFYVTEDRHVLPAADYVAQYVPVVTGDFDVPFENGYSGAFDFAFEDDDGNDDFFSTKSYAFIAKLINFVDYIRADSFWNSQIVQIHVSRGIQNTARAVSGMPGILISHSREPQVELIPRAGSHTIILGGLDGYEHKLDKLMFFYMHALSKEGWDRWDFIDLRFRGQVVCR